MLVVTTTVGMVHGVHSHTTSAGPVVTLSLEFMVCTAGLEQRLVDTSTTSHDSDRRTRRSRDGLLRTAGQPDTGLVLLGRVSDDGGIVTRRACEGTTVANFLLDVADDGTLGAHRDGEDVADGQCGFLAGIDEGTGMETFSRDEGFFPELVAVGVTEDNASKGSTTARVVDDLLYDPPNVSISLREIKRAQLGGVLV